MIQGGDGIIDDGPELCGTSISSNEFSRVAAQLDPFFEQWRTRPLDPMRHLFLNARCDKVRVGGTVRNCAVLIGTGIHDSDGRRVPHEASLLRLASAIRMEIFEDWETSKCYLSLPKRPPRCTGRGLLR